MEEIQSKQVKLLARQLALPDGQGRHAAVCLAHMVKPGNSLVAQEALNALIDALKYGDSAEGRKWAAWALGGLAASVNTHDLSDRIVPALIRVLHPVDLDRVDLHVAGQAYHSLLYIGTPDAVAAAESYKARVIEARMQQRTTSL